LITRTWPYGTKKRVKIVDWRVANDEQLGRVVMALCEHIDESEMTVCLISIEAVRAMTFIPDTGQLRVIEFRQGGPTGGHWMIVDEPAAAGGVA